MDILIMIVILGLGFAFFATQNMTSVTVNLTNYSFNVPLYIVVIISMLAGLFLSFIISLIESISTNFTIWGKENKIKQARERIAKLNHHVEELERKNNILKAKSTAKDSNIRPA